MSWLMRNTWAGHRQQFSQDLIFTTDGLMNKSHPSRAYATIISTLCVVVLGSILIAGLWPFHSPRNGVSWIEEQNGLRFSGHGAAVSSTAFRIRRPPNDTGSSLEIWLTPERTTGDGSILAFDSSPKLQVPFLLRQYGSTIAVQRYLMDEQGKVTHPWFKCEGVFRDERQVLVTITSGKQNTAVYVNGVLAETSYGAGIVGRELTGPLLLANSTVDDSWSGSITGLAIYDRELSPTQVVKHLESWTPEHGPSLTGEQVPTALYLFNERAGNTVHNQFDPATDLTIPATYFVLHPAFLRSTWNQYSYTRSVWKRWSSWQDLSLNIIGFVPVGFVFFAYFSSVRPIRQPALIAILLGLSLSFMVEAGQRFLPTRDSGMNDLFTNTTGTALGVLLYRLSFVRMLWSKALASVGFPSEVQSEAAVESVAPVGDEKLAFFA
jgi:VanZ family protein